ncbi:hypothetical protein I656_01182 [Geobacillus sp. WSUCF1]|nr:hypothetical protein I656_01182 [Geobacillus sp. WSUCF1]
MFGLMEIFCSPLSWPDKCRVKTQKQKEKSEHHRDG